MSIRLQLVLKVIYNIHYTIYQSIESTLSASVCEDFSVSSPSLLSSHMYLNPLKDRALSLTTNQANKTAI